MNNTELLAKLEREIQAYKVGQDTQGDSANYYHQEYIPGWFINSDTTRYRDHTIKCVPETVSENAVFMAIYAAASLNVQSMFGAGRLPTQSQNVFTWRQYAEDSSKMSDSGYAIGVPKGMMFLSNVDFHLETSYIEGSS